MADKVEKQDIAQTVDHMERRAVARFSDQVQQPPVAMELPKDSPYQALVASAHQPEKHPDGTLGFYKDMAKFGEDLTKAALDKTTPKESLQQFAAINDHLTQAVLKRTENLTQRYANAQMHNEGGLSMNPVG